MKLSTLSGPATEPLSVAEAKAHLNLTHDDDDSYIESLVVAARVTIERMLDQTLITSTHEARLDDWPCGAEIRLPRCPLISVASVTYYDALGDVATLAASNYYVSAGSPGRIARVSGASWPARQIRPDAIVIRFDAGYGDESTDVPMPIRHAIRLLVAHWYESRESVSATTMNEVPHSLMLLLSAMEVGRYA